MVAHVQGAIQIGAQLCCFKRSSSSNRRKQIQHLLQRTSARQIKRICGWICGWIHALSAAALEPVPHLVMAQRRTPMRNWGLCPSEKTPETNIPSVLVKQLRSRLRCLAVVGHSKTRCCVLGMTGHSPQYQLIGGICFAARVANGPM